eukprot:768695-Pyramimonas_sp.AAC.1
MAMGTGVPPEVPEGLEGHASLLWVDVLLRPPPLPLVYRSPAISPGPRVGQRRGAFAELDLHLRRRLDPH